MSHRIHVHVSRGHYRRSVPAQFVRGRFLLAYANSDLSTISPVGVERRFYLERTHEFDNTNDM